MKRFFGLCDFFMLISCTAPGDLVKLYLDKHHLPMRSVVKTTNGTITITYSQYNVPITIHP